MVQDRQPELIDLDKLKPAEYNPRIIDKIEYQALKQSYKTYGQVQPFVVNKDMTIIGGHQGYKVMQELGEKQALCVVVDLDKKEEKKLNVILNSNKVGGRYDDLKLAELLEEFKLDEDYNLLRLNELEPLDLSPETREQDRIEDAFTTTPDDWANASIKKVELFFTNEEFPHILELMKLAQDKATVDNNTEAVKAALEAYVNE